MKSVRRNTTPGSNCCQTISLETWFVSEMAMLHHEPTGDTIHRATVIRPLKPRLRKRLLFPQEANRLLPNPNITLCAELVEEMASKNMVGAISFAYLHELAHTLMKQWGLPLWDNEDAADEFATAFLLIGKQDAIALQAAQYWASPEHEHSRCRCKDLDGRQAQPVSAKGQKHRPLDKGSQ